MSTSWKAIVGVILIFIFGFFSGVICTSIVVHRKVVTFLQHPGMAVVDAFEKRVTRNLNLDADQKRQFHEDLLQNMHQREILQKQIQPQVQALNQTTLQQINAMLRPDQQDRLRQNLDAMRERFGNATGEKPPPLGQPNLPSTNSGAETPPRGQ